MLQQKVDSLVNDIGNEKDAKEVLDGGDDGVAITSFSWFGYTWRDVCEVHSQYLNKNEMYVELIF